MRMAELHDRVRTNWPDAYSLRAELHANLARLGQCLERSMRDALLQHELTPTEFDILATLRCSDPPHELLPSQLYDAVLLSSGGTTKTLRALENAGLIARADTRRDRRQRPVTLTPAGEKRLNAAMQAVNAAQQRHMQRAALSDSRLKTLNGLVTTLLEAYEPA